MDAVGAVKHQRPVGRIGRRPEKGSVLRCCFPNKELVNSRIEGRRQEGEIAGTPRLIHDGEEFFGVPAGDGEGYFPHAVRQTVGSVVLDLARRQKVDDRPDAQRVQSGNVRFREVVQAS